MKKDASNELWQFFAAYFHQDWTYLASTPDEVLDDYLRASSISQRAHLADLVEAFAAERDDETLKRDLFGELSCYYDPEADGQSARSWMQHVAQRLRSER